MQQMMRSDSLRNCDFLTGVEGESVSILPHPELRRCGDR
jgi:hypothetical protein